MLNKRLIILISAIIGILIITGIVLWLLFKTPTAEPIEQPKEEERVSIPVTPSQEEELLVFKLSDTAAISPAISGDKVMYYSKADGTLFETDFRGSSTKSLTNFKIPDIITSIWSYNNSKVINIYKENGNIRKTMYDTSSNKATLLDSRIKFINFSTSQDKIVYQFIDNPLGINKISTSDPNGLNWKNIQNIRMENVKLYWPKEDTIAILTAPSGIVKGSLLSTTTDTTNGGSLTKVLSELFGLTVKYSDDGKLLLYSQTDQYGHSPSLYLLKENEISEDMRLNTISDKCAFSKNNNIYCAVPSVINGSLILPDDFYKGITSFSDSFFKIDIQNNRNFSLFDTKYLKDLGYDFNASDLVVSPNEGYLVFINKKDGLLYSIKID